MIIRKHSPKTGICFAWLPVWTSEGKVWLEWVHYRFNDTEFGSWSYERFVPQDRYDAGDRAQNKFWGGKAYDDGSTTSYETPPGDPKKFCHNYRTNGPTPCHYPDCKVTDEHGVTRCNRDGIGFGEW